MRGLEYSLLGLLFSIILYKIITILGESEIITATFIICVFIAGATGVIVESIESNKINKK